MAIFTITTAQNRKQRVYSFGDDRHIKMCVYKITNKVNGKAYIGQSKGSVVTRWRSHCNKSSSGVSAIGRAIQKYGKDAFKFEVIAYCKDVNELNNVEKMLIDIDATMYPNGYNLHTGGNSHIPSEISRLRMKESACKRFGVTKSRSDIRQSMTEEDKALAYSNRIEKMKQTKTGKPSPKRGTTLPAHIVEKIRLSKIGKEVPTRWKKIISSDGVVFDSVKHAVNEIGCNRTTLMKNLKGKLKTVYGKSYTYLVQEV